MMCCCKTVKVKHRRDFIIQASEGCGAGVEPGEG